MILDVGKAIDESIAVKRKLRSQTEKIFSVGILAARVLQKGGKILLFGNGGSAADSQHVAAELVGMMTRHRMSLPALALTTNTSVLTAISNDLSFDHVFSRQVEGLATKNDLVIAISTSGMSKNVLEGLRAARRKGLETVALTGQDGGEAARLARISIKVPSRNTQRIQEAHILIGHLICEIIESELFSSSPHRKQPRTLEESARGPDARSRKNQ